MERFGLDAYQVQMILDLKIGFGSLAKRQARAWDNNRWTLAEYLAYRYKQEFGKSRAEKPAFVPPRSKPGKMKRINGANRPTPAHPFYEQKAMVMRQARERVGLTVPGACSKDEPSPRDYRDPRRPGQPQGGVVRDHRRDSHGARPRTQGRSPPGEAQSTGGWGKTEHFIERGSSSQGSLTRE